MEPTTQAMLVGGLLALLTVLLIGRSVGRRRARQAADDAGATPMPIAVEDVELEPEPEPETAPAAPTRRRGLRRRRSDRADQPDITDVTDVPAQPAQPDVPLAVDAATETADQAEVRALREQLRALEQVVQQQAADHPTAALARVEETAAQQSEAYLRQVSLVVRGLAAHTSEDESPRRTLARVAAAVERLGVPNQMERPILPVTKELSSRPQRGPAAPSHRLETGGEAAPAHDPVPDVFAGPLAGPVDEPLGFGPDAHVAPVHPSVDPSVESDGGLAAYQLSDAVLPVPPPAAPEVSGRRRGLSRKSR